MPLKAGNPAWHEPSTSLTSVRGIARHANATAPSRLTKRRGAVAWHCCATLPASLRPNVQDAEHLGLDHLLERDFGRDSLARVEWLVRIERELGAKLGEKAFVDAETPRDLLRQIVGTVSAETPAPDGASVFAEVKVYHPPQAVSTLIEILDWHVTRHAERVHLTLYDEEERTEDITYCMLQEQAKALAAGLHQHGLSSGDKVAITLPCLPDADSSPPSMARLNEPDAAA